MVGKLTKGCGDQGARGVGVIKEETCLKGIGNTPPIILQWNLRIGVGARCRLPLMITMIRQNSLFECPCFVSGVTEKIVEMRPPVDKGISINGANSNF